MVSKKKTALIIGASGGIGTALVNHCRYEGYDVKELSRSKDGFDVTSEDSVREAAARVSGGLDLIVVATGALEIDGQGPEKTIQKMTAERLVSQFKTNAVGPALILKYFSPKLTKSRRAVMVILSARVGSIGDNHLGGWISYRTAKAALNQIVHTAAIELERKNPTAICIAYHPGTVATKLTKKYVGDRPTVTPKDAVHDLMTCLNARTIADTGKFFDWAGKQVQW